MPSENLPADVKYVTKKRIEYDASIIMFTDYHDCKLSYPLPCRHTSKPGPDSDSDLDSDPKKTRTREKPGLVLGLAFEKPGLDNRKSGLQIENTGFDETGF